MANSGISDAPVQGFISYRRDDNDQFGGVVDELAKVLAGLFEARTGQKLQLFLDRESIGWGEDWREKIDASVRQAIFFIPIITMRYFSSQACMDELTAFESAARQLGVTDLILPIVLFGSDEISEDDERPEVRLIARLNYRSLEAAWEAGFQSSEWRHFMNERAKELAKAMSSAELALASLPETTQMPTSPVSEAGRDGDELAEGEELDFDPFAMFSRFEEATAALNEANAALTELGTRAESFDLGNLDGMSPGQVNARLLAMARDLSEPSRNLERTGTEAERIIREIDPLLRTWLEQLGSINLPAAREQRQSFIESISDTESVDETEAQISELSSTIQFVSLMNVGLRKSLRPAVNGLRSMLTAVRIYQGWQRLSS